MARFDMVDTQDENAFDAVIEVGFAQPLSTIDVALVLQKLLDVVTSSIGKKIFEGFSHVEVTEHLLRVDFRFSRVPQTSQLSPSEIEDLSRLRPQFIFYTFAVLDGSFPLADVPFPPGFRSYLSLPEYISDE